VKGRDKSKIGGVEDGGWKSLAVFFFEGDSEWEAR
jgi:hypothetical protein